MIAVQAVSFLWKSICSTLICPCAELMVYLLLNCETFKEILSQ